MARTLNDIKLEIYTSFLSNTTLEEMYEFNPLQDFESQFSKLSLEYNIIAVISFSIYVFEQIFGISSSKMTEEIKIQKVHSTSWYSELAKKFQLGHSLPFGETEYETVDEISRIVKYCAVTKTPGGLRVKIAGESGGELSPLATSSFNAFKDYMELVKGAGDELFYTNEVADDLKLVYNIYYDPLVLNALGERLDGTANTPVNDAIDSFLKRMDFDGRFIPSSLTDSLQQVNGVIVPELIEAASKYALLPYAEINGSGVVPNSGYLRIESLTINYIAWQI